MVKYTSYTVSELQTINKELIKKIDYANRNLEQLYSVKEEIDRILNKYNKETDLGARVLIPHDFMESLRRKGRAHLNVMNWKAMVLETIAEYDCFFTTERIYLINKIKYPNEFAEKEKAIRNISSALRYLFLEKKISKFKDHNGKYSYGLYDKHFDNKGKPIEEYIK